LVGWVLFIFIIRNDSVMGGRISKFNTSLRAGVSGKKTKILRKKSHSLSSLPPSSPHERSHAATLPIKPTEQQQQDKEIENKQRETENQQQRQKEREVEKGEENISKPEQKLGTIISKEEEEEEGEVEEGEGEGEGEEEQEEVKQKLPSFAGYKDEVVRVQRPRGRSISDSLFRVKSDGSRDINVTDMQKSIENEKAKKRRFQEMNALLSARNVVIDITDLTFLNKVGEGAFSEVWEGWWNGVHVAIKKLKLMVDDALFEERFLREVENLRKGNHHNVVMFYGVCLKPACIVTEFMGGGNLYDLLHKQHVSLSFPLIIKMATDLAVGFSHLHALSILHRDLTSLNVLLDEMGNVKISDFGLSREKAQEGSMTMTLGGICNPRWRPPEITKNSGKYSEKMDVYCFALVVWEMLSGQIPFADLDGSQAAAQVAYTNLRPPIPPTCHSSLGDLLQQCWQDDPKLRPDFRYIAEKLRQIAWMNPMGLVSEMAHTPPTASPLTKSRSTNAPGV